MNLSFLALETRATASMAPCARKYLIPSNGMQTVSGRQWCQPQLTAEETEAPRRWGTCWSPAGAWTWAVQLLSHGSAAGARGLARDVLGEQPRPSQTPALLMPCPLPSLSPSSFLPSHPYPPLLGCLPWGLAAREETCRSWAGYQNTWVSARLLALLFGPGSNLSTPALIIPPSL